MTFFRELWRRRQLEKALGGDLTRLVPLDEAEASPEASDRSSSPSEASTHACGDWAGAHLRAFGLKEAGR